MAFHWVQSGAASPISTSNNVYAGCSVTIPAGGVLKKFVVYNTFLDCYLTTPDERGIWPLHVKWLLSYFSTSYPSRPLHETYRDATMSVYTYYDSGINSTQPHCIFHGADNEFGFQGKTSYGGPGKASATVQLTGSCSTNIPFVPSGMVIQGTWSASLKCLYEL